MTDLRKAAEMALDALNKRINGNFDGYPYSDLEYMSVLALRQALAQPVDAVNISEERVDETAKREHEPVAYVTIEPSLPNDWRKCPSIKWFNKPTEGPLYTAPPQREWVGLTSDDVHDAFNYVEMVKLLDFDRDRPEWCEAFASACEATLRHKNGGNK